MQVRVAVCPHNPILVGAVVTVIDQDYVPSNKGSWDNPLLLVRTPTGRIEHLFLSDCRPLTHPEG